jgi:hypothetical protein
VNQADIIGVAAILLCGIAGMALGSIRALFGFVGMMLAYTVTNPMLGQPGVTSGAYVGKFLGVFVVTLIVGFLVYGKTRTTIIESMEAVFGFIIFAIVGWGIAKFIYTDLLWFHPYSPITAMIATGQFANDIYIVKPYQVIMNNSTTLRNPGKL